MVNFMESMETPSTREEFEHRLQLMREAILNDRLQFAPGLGRGLDEIRLLPNGRIDLLSINESTRLNANMMHQMNDERLKKMMDDNEDNA